MQPIDIFVIIVINITTKVQFVVITEFTIQLEKEIMVTSKICYKNIIGITRYNFAVFSP